jgi:NAD(P)-dependent dehydrogenase (short-subunit alcohol dehydrogenase family)
VGSLDGKVVVVTGAGRGIGRATALLAAAEGASVIVNDLGCEVDGTGSSPDPARRVSEEIAAAGGRCSFTTGDMGSESGAEETIRAALDQFGRIDALVLATGIRRDRPIWTVSENDWDEAVAHVLRGYFLPTKYATIIFRQQRGGRIVMLTSDAGLGAPGRSTLAAASEGIVGLSRTVARDVGRYGVTCNAVSAQADTRLFSAAADAWRRGRGLIDPEEVAGLPAPAADGWQDAGSAWDAANVAPLICFLCTDGSADINGQVLGARGGDVYLYSNPAIDRSIHTWGRRFNLDELDVLGPRSLGHGVAHPAPALSSV